jgi:hypothetical protein
MIPSAQRPYERKGLDIRRNIQVGKYELDMKWRVIRNVSVVGEPYMFIFIGMSGTEGLQSSINTTQEHGTVAIGAIYFVVVTIDTSVSTVIIP